MADARPLVSVVICNYNYGALLPDALDSVLAQTWQPLETIVVDDGSTDESRSVLERYPVRAIFQANAGQAAAMNAGLTAARGDVVCLLDADDGWAPTKVERVMEALTRYPDAAWVRHRLEIVDAELRRTGRAIPRIRASGPVPASPAAFAERVVTASTSAIAVRRAALAHVLPLPVGTRLRYDADAVLLAGIGSRLPGCQLSEVLGFYRRHDRQQFAGTDVKRLLERQIEVGSLIAAAVGRGEPVSNHKHRAVVAALDGRPRAGAVLAGLAAALRLLPHPLLMARQTAGLVYAAALPGRWLDRVRREQGLG